MKQKRNRLISSMLVLLTMTMFFSDTSAQNRLRNFVADTGVINLKPNQTLRVTVTPRSDTQTYRIRFRRCTYIEQDNVFVVDSSQIGPLILMPANEARSFSTSSQDSGLSVRVRASSNNPNIVARFQLVDTSTGEVVWEDEAVVHEQDVWAVN